MIEERPKQPKNASTSKINPTGQAKGNRADSYPPLPWWVELLFVQIGLPDKWLRSFLKKRKKAKGIVRNHEVSFTSALIVFLLILYTLPIVRQAQNNVSCVSNVRKIMINELLLEDEIGNKEAHAWSNRFCNGGSIE